MAIYTLRSGANAHTEDQVLQLGTDIVTTGGVLSVVGNHLAVQQQTSPDMTVKVLLGHAYVKGATGSAYPVIVDANTNVTIGANSSGNPRIDAVVLYIDKAATPTTTADNVAKLIAVQGTPAGSPTAPSDGTVQTAVGASNPFLRLANVTVASGATSIVTANIADVRVVVGLYPPARATARAYLSGANQTIANNTVTKVTLNAENFDPGGNFDTSNYRYVAPVTGYYLVSATANFAASATGRRRVELQVNGSAVALAGEQVGDSANSVRRSITDTIYMTAGQYVEFCVLQNSGGDLAIVYLSYETYMSVNLIGVA